MTSCKLQSNVCICYSRRSHYEYRVGKAVALSWNEIYLTKMLIYILRSYGFKTKSCIQKYARKSIYHEYLVFDRQIHYSGSLFGLPSARLAMPTSEPRDGFFDPYLILVKGTYIIVCGLLCPHSPAPLSPIVLKWPCNGVRIIKPHIIYLCHAVEVFTRQDKDNTKNASKSFYFMYKAIEIADHQLSTAQHSYLHVSYVLHRLPGH